MLKLIRSSVLEIAYLDRGEENGWPAILLHGFPYDVHAFDEAASLLASKGARVIVPYLRGFGPTRFLSENTPRSGQQAALGNDLLSFMDSLKLKDATLAGYDWGGRAACIVAALWPHRVRGLVTGNSYNIQNILASLDPREPEDEHRIWYQYYLHSERGRLGLQRDRRAFCRLLWKLWSPTWNFTQEQFDRTATSFDNADFLEVVVQSYRHRFGLAAGDPDLEPIERRLSGLPDITVPTIALEGLADGVMPRAGTREHARKFAGRFEFRNVNNAGHNLPQEAPRDFADAVIEAEGWAERR